ncbi:integrin beta-1-binding protein 1 isoform X2 [Balaenoptera musculus]|uniref:Integrin beta-1-binding protein 1 isoform X2 n=1 Tax=Balaenoptera musculus TaxID=9771 RepID=A0A8B8Z1G8_BALMU|nr:integrin beta-1-binding protein 1 isoform X2 [Balaenoptera musculus]
MFRKGKKRHSSSSSQSSEISTKSKSVDSSLGGLSRSSTVASLDTDSTKSSGQSNSNSDTCAEFRIKYVGAIEKLKLSEGKSLEGPLDLINYIDVAQLKILIDIFESRVTILQAAFTCPKPWGAGDTRHIQHPARWKVAFRSSGGRIYYGSFQVWYKSIHIRSV